MRSILKRYIAILCTIAMMLTEMPIIFAADTSVFDAELSTTTSSEIETFVSIAKGEVGYIEKKSNANLDSKTANAGQNNYTKYWRDIKPSDQGKAWCACFVSWCASQAGLSKIIPKFTGCSTGYNKTLPSAGGTKHKSKYRGNNTYTPKKGDIIFFWHTSDNDYNGIHHVGIVYKVADGKVYYYDGNSGKNTDRVCDNNKALGDYQIYGYITPKYSEDPPAAPTIKSAEASSTSAITVKWGKVSDATKYRVDRRKSGNDTKYETVKTTTDLEYTDTGLSANTVYYYRVYAINDAGTSKSSETYQSHTKPKTPDKPSVEIDSDSQLTVMWNKVSGATKYKVLGHVVGKDDWEVLATVTDTKYVHKGLKAGTKYFYRIQAVTCDDIGSESSRSQKDICSEQSETKTKFTKLARPENDLNDDNDQYVDLSWKKATGDSTYVYDVYRDGERINTNHVNGTTYTDTGAKPGKIYKYQIKVLDTKDKYNNICYSDKFYAAPKIEKAISVTPKDSSSMTISWDKPSGAPDGTKYMVKRWNGDSWTDLTTTTSTSYVDTNLSAGSSYAYYIQVRDPENKYVTSTYHKEATLDISPSRVSLSKSEVTLTEGESITLSADIQPDNSFNKNVTWSSSDSNVAAVDNGVVTAIAAGSTNITVTTSNGKTASCTVTVNSAGCTEHEYGEWIIDTEATCEQSGSRHRVCEKCGSSESEVILATGHSYSEEWQTVTEATCTTEGEEARICSVCGAKTDAHAVATTEHSFGEWQRDGESTCSQDGTETRTCSVCGFVETQVVEAKDHDYELTAQTEATSDGPGSRTYTCKTCGNIFTEEYVPEIKQGTLTITADKTAPEIGSEITMAVTMSDNPGMSGFRLSVNYDKNVLTPKSITPGDALTAGSFESNLNDPNVSLEDLDAVWAAWENNEDISDNGVLFNVTFTVKDTAPDGTYAVTLNYDKGEITTTSESAPYYDIMPDTIDEYITISDLVMGDVNLDRSVNSRDGVMLLQYLAHWHIDLTERQQQAADVYTDNKITMKDGVKLSQMLAGYKFDTDDSAEAATVSLMSDETASIEIGTGVSLPGQNVYVPVMINENLGISAFDIKLNYDSDYLTPVSVIDGDILTAGSVTTSVDDNADSDDEDCITVLWNDSDDIAEDGTLFMIEFLVSENAQIGQTLPITISTEDDIACDQNLNVISTTVTQGEIEVVESTEGEPEEYEYSGDYMQYSIDNVLMQNSDGTAYEAIPSAGNFDLVCGITAEDETQDPGTLIAAEYDASGTLISIQSTDVTADVIAAGNCNLHIDETSVEIAKIKLFIWDSLTGMTPMSETVIIPDTEVTE